MCKSIILCFLLLGAWGMQPSRAQITNLWAWESGSNAPNASATYGGLGTSSTSYWPGGRYGSSGMAGSTSYFWIFGGTDGAGNYFNDLWTYVPGTGYWGWISGKNTANKAGVYGTPGVEAFGQYPGARYGQSGWTDKSGYLWIYGGYGYDVNGNVGALNDLWRFNTSNFSWTWMSGSNNASVPGVYGTQGAEAAGQFPGARSWQSAWMDKNGNFWVFGGNGYDEIGRAHV